MYHMRDTVQVDLLSKLSAHCPLSLRGRMAELLSFRERLNELKREKSMLVETSNRAHVANAAAAQLPKSPKTQAFEGVVMYYGYRYYDQETGRWRPFVASCLASVTTLGNHPQKQPCSSSSTIAKNSSKNIASGCGG
jgi:hypothetical protein